MRTIALALSLVIIFLIPWEGVVQFPGLGTAAKLIGLALAAFWVATVVITGRLRRPGPFHLAVYLFVLWNAVSIFWSATPNRTVAHVATWGQLLVFVFILWDLYTTRTALLAGLQAYVLGAYVAFGSAVANYLSGESFYTHYDRFSPGDTNPDGFGFTLVLGIPLAWYLAGSKSTTHMGRFLKLVNYAYIPAALLGISLSGTRTALIATIPAMAFGLASLTRLRLWARLAIFLLLMSAVLILLPHVQTLRSFQRLGTTGVEITEGDLNNRTNNWREGLASFAEHPLTGVGSNAYRSVNSLGKVAHNSYLSVLVEVGLIGFALFGMILAIAVIQAWGQPKWDSSFWLSLLAVWAIGASTLTWEHRKSTWLFLSLIVASAALTRHRDEAVPLVQHDRSVGQLVRQAQWNKPPLFIFFVLAVFFSGLVLGSPAPLPETALAQTADPVLVGAGDIANCNRTQDGSTAQLLDGIAGTVVTLGDNAYPDGTPTQFTNCYGPTWGRHKNRTRPSPGNHDYHTAGAAGYYTYFGAAASPRDTNCTSNCQGYYSYNLGGWHIIALNSELAHGAGSAQEQWLRADLAANQNLCTLAYWHKPRFSSGQHGNNSTFQPFWRALYEYGADVVLNGHDHTYERFAPQNPGGQADPARGIREFVVGTGGAGLYPFPAVQANSQVRNNSTWGVLKLTLHPTSYDWEFIPVAGQTFTDAGSANCIGAGPAPTATPAPTPAATPTPMPGGSTTMHVGDLDRASSSPSNKWTANVTITIHDANHNPVANAAVRGAWSNGASGTASCTTSSNGQCSVSKSDIPKGKNSVTFTVNNATHATLAYASANNHDPDGDSNGATIIVPRP